MRKNTSIAIMFALMVLLHCEGNVFAQQPQSKCSQIGYSAPSTNLKSFRTNHVEGQAVYASTTAKWELGPGNDLCVTLFRRNNGDLVASVTTDGRGQFEFANIAPGEYVLISVAGDLQQINVPIEIVSAAKVKPQRLLLHLREREDNRKSHVTKVTNLTLRKELLAMVQQDQDIRNELVKSGVDHPKREISERMDAIDSRNTAKMKRIVKQYNWPRAELVGWDGTEAAFLVVQHSSHSFQKALLPLMQKEYGTGHLSGPNYALFLDRVLVEDGRPQVYGSRAKGFNRDGEPILYPIEDEANVDKRRAEVGLSSLAEYREMMKQKYHPQSKQQ
jgi:hypothetical protein